MAKETPSCHAGLVTFNAEVTLIGDGSGDSRIVAGDRLSNDEALREVGRAYPLSSPVSEARSRLSDRLFALEEGGPTALGPAVVAGLSMLRVRCVCACACVFLFFSHFANQVKVVSFFLGIRWQVLASYCRVVHRGAGKCRYVMKKYIFRTSSRVS